MSGVNVGGYPVELGEVGLLSCLMLRLWVAVVLYQPCVQGDGSWGLGGNVGMWKWAGVLNDHTPSPFWRVAGNSCPPSGALLRF